PLIGSIISSPADCGDEGLELRRIEFRISELRHVSNPLQDSTFDLWQDRLHLIENACEEGRSLRSLGEQHGYRHMRHCVQVDAVDAWVGVLLDKGGRVTHDRFLCP